MAKRVIGRRRGATALTYGLVVGLVALGSLSAVTRIGGGVDSLFGTVSSTLSDAAALTGSSTQGDTGAEGPAPVGFTCTSGEEAVLQLRDGATTYYLCPYRRSPTGAGLVNPQSARVGCLSPGASMDTAWTDGAGVRYGAVSYELALDIDTDDVVLPVGRQRFEIPCSGSCTGGGSVLIETVDQERTIQSFGSAGNSLCRQSVDSYVAGVEDSPIYTSYWDFSPRLQFGHHITLFGRQSTAIGIYPMTGYYAARRENSVALALPADATLGYYVERGS